MIISMVDSTIGAGENKGAEQERMNKRRRRSEKEQHWIRNKEEEVKQEQGIRGAGIEDEAKQEPVRNEALVK